MVTSMGVPISYRRIKANIVDKRTFVLSVHPNVNVFSQQPRKGWMNAKMKNGLYFNYMGNNRIPETVINTLYAYIMNEVATVSAYMVRFWKRFVNTFFNRRAYGMYYHEKSPLARGVAKNIKRDMHQHKPAYRNRHNTNGLRDAFKRTKPMVIGCKFYVDKCMRRGYDYVAVLIRGTTMKRHAYVPNLDIRVKSGVWHGITNKYWERWWRFFVRELYKQERLMNIRIMRKIVDYKIASINDIKYDPTTKNYASMYIQRQEAIKMDYFEIRDYGIPLTYMKRGWAPFEGYDAQILGGKVLPPLHKW